MNTTETKHTPGPWRLMNSHKAGFVNVYATHNTGNSVDNIATDFICEIGPGARAAGEANSNARLIASAPQLLAALQACVDSIEVYQSHGSRSDRESLTTAATQARAALANHAGKGEKV